MAVKKGKVNLQEVKRNKSVKVLIVEDEQIVALDIENNLKEMGYCVTGIAASGKEALEKIEKTKPDLVLMDIVLKGKMDGIEVAAKINKRYSLPSIFLTAYADEEKIKRAKAAQPFGYILKPFEKRDIKVAIEMAIHKYKSDQKVLTTKRELKSALEEKEILLKELHHRVKNNLQLISSLLNLQASAINDKRLLTAFTESQNRIRSIMLIHDHLYISNDFANIDFSQYIKQLTNHLFAAYQIENKDIKLIVDVKDVFLGIQQGVPCGLIINELVTNAFKHAFINSNKKKMMHISMTSQGKKIKLTISDNGVGLPSVIDPKKPKTLGLRLVKMLAKQLEGTYQILRKPNTTFTILF